MHGEHVLLLENSSTMEKPELEQPGKLALSSGICRALWAGWQMPDGAVAERGDKQCKCISIKQHGLCSQ